MQLWTAFILGLAGSLHCAAMCGPLTLLVPVTGPKTSQRIASRLIYNFGRLLTYTLLGTLFGTFGNAFAIAGLQRWLSIAAGSLILLVLIFSIFDFRFSIGPIRIVTAVKSKFSTLLRKRTRISIATLGTLNGLLPCGLVYVAATASATTASPLNGALYMFVFGLGTIPALLIIAFGSSLLRFNSFNLKRIVPTVAAIAGLLLIMRGLALGIPYISPAPNGHCPACLHAKL